MCGLLILTFVILTFGLGAPSMAQPGGQPPDAAGWARCHGAPTRRCVLRHALEVAKTLMDHTESLVAHATIAAAQVDAGLAQDASATVELLGPLLRPPFGPDASSPVSREVRAVVDRVKAIVARTEADAGKLEEAMSTASAISEPGIRGSAIGSIAIAEGKAGSIDNALKRVQSVQDHEERAIAVRRAAWGLRFIAMQRGEDDKIAEALRQSQSIDVERYAFVVVDLVSQELGTLTFYDSESNAWLMAMPALQIIVEAQIRAGKIVEAMQVVRSVERKGVDQRVEEFDRARVFAAIVKYLAGAGRVSEALRLALELGDPLVLDNPFVLDSFAMDRSAQSIIPASRGSTRLWTRDLLYPDTSGDDRQSEMRA